MLNLEQDIKRLNDQSQAEVTSEGYNNIMLLVGEKKRTVERLKTILENE